MSGTGYDDLRADPHDKAVAWMTEQLTLKGWAVTDLQHMKAHCKDLRVGNSYADIKTRQPFQSNWTIEHACLERKDLPVFFFMIDYTFDQFRLLHIWSQSKVRAAIGDCEPRQPTLSNDPWHLLTDECELIR